MFTLRCFSTRVTTAIVPTCLLLGMVLRPIASRGDYAAVVLSDGAGPYYRLNETGGTTAVDASAVALNGTYVSPESVTFSQPSLLPLESDAAVEFSSTGIQLPTTTSPATESIEGWFKPKYIFGSTALVVRVDGTGFLQQMLWITDTWPKKNRLAYSFSVNGTQYNVVSTTTVLQGSIYYVAVSVSMTGASTNVRLYVNGVKEASVTVAGTPLTGSRWQIGLGDAALRDFWGVIDEVAFYTTILSPEQVSNHYVAAGYTPVPTATPSPTPTFTLSPTPTFTPFPITATFTVNSILDGADANPGDGICATSTGRCTLRAAVQEANASSGAQLIVVPAGLYNLTIGGRNEEAAVTGDLDVTDTVKLDGAGAKSTVITGYGLDRVFDVHQPAHLMLSGVTISNGLIRAGDDATDRLSGGGMKNEGTVSLTDVVFRRNRSGRDGGGLYNLGTAILSNLIFSRNAAADADQDDNSAGSGGGVMNLGTIGLTDVTFAGNRAGHGTNNRNYPTQHDGGSGGGMVNAGSATLTRVAFQRNRAGNGAFEGNGGSGGGMLNTKACVVEGPDCGTATLNEVIFQSNNAGNGGSSHDFGGDGGDGGGLSSDGYAGTVNVSNARFTHNHAGKGGNSSSEGGYGGYGGGMAVGGQHATLSNVTFDKNHAGNGPHGGGGGGGGFYGSGTLTNVTIASNRAGNGNGRYSLGGWGGGLSGDGMLTNVTIAFNHAGKITHGGAATGEPGTGDNLDFIGAVANTIVAGSAQNCSDQSNITSGGHNIDSGTSCRFAAGSDLEDTNPHLADLKDNGGFAPTMALPGYGATLDAVAVDDGPCPATDERGVSRPQGIACDIGAYELEQ